MNDSSLNQTSAMRYDSDDDMLAPGDDRHTIQTYVSDALALERHIALPLARQLDLEDSATFSAALAVITRIKSTTDAHIATLERHVASGGGSTAASVKSAFSQLLGAGAAAIGGARKTKVSKNLRDDYTALSLASISYTMLHATALGLGDHATAAIAQTHLEDYAPIIMDISKIISGLVLVELRLDGEDVNAEAADLATENTQSAWSNS